MSRDPRKMSSSLNIIRTTIVTGLSHICRVCTRDYYWVLSRAVFRGEIKAVAQRLWLWMGSWRIEMLGRGQEQALKGKYVYGEGGGLCRGPHVDHSRWHLSK